MRGVPIVQASGHLFDFLVFWAGSQVRVSLKMPFRRKTKGKSGYRRRRSRKTSMKRSFKRGKRGGKRGGKFAKQMFGMLKWSGDEFIPQSFMTKHRYAFQEDAVAGTPNVIEQWKLLDPGHPFVGGGDAIPRGMAEMDTLYSIWQVMGVAYELSYLNQSGVTVELTVFPQANTDTIVNYLDVRNMPFAQRRFVLQTTGVSVGNPRATIKGYINVRGLAGRNYQMDQVEFQGQGLAVGGGPIQDFRLTVMQNGADAITTMDWTWEMRLTYYIKWSSPEPVTVPNVSTVSDARSYAARIEQAKDTKHKILLRRKAEREMLDEAIEAKRGEEKVREEMERVEICAEYRAPRRSPSIVSSCSSAGCGIKRRIKPTLMNVDEK